MIQQDGDLADIEAATRADELLAKGDPIWEGYANEGGSMGNIRTPVAVSVISGRINEDVVTLTLRAANGQLIEVRLKPEIMSALTAALVASLGKLGPQPTQDTISAQLITVTGARPALTPQRQPILNLTIEGSGYMPITFPRSAIGSLQNALAELLELSKPTSMSH